MRVKSFTNSNRCWLIISPTPMTRCSVTLKTILFKLLIISILSLLLKYFLNDWIELMFLKTTLLIYRMLTLTWVDCRWVWETMNPVSSFLRRVLIYVESITWPGIIWVFAITTMTTWLKVWIALISAWRFRVITKMPSRLEWIFVMIRSWKARVEEKMNVN